MAAFAALAGTRAAWSAEAPPPAAHVVDYARDVRPILSQHCWKCHGPDQASRKGKLRLDDRDAATAKMAIVPGNAAGSELVKRIESEDDEEQMPPPKAKLPLSAVEKQTLRDWVQQGAKYAKHWSLVVPQRPPVPDVENGKWPRDAIDHFVLHRLEQEKLAPSPEADRSTLLRRVFLDLTGIPPSTDELEAFLADQSPDAYEKTVDRLLASPRYGERMAMGWMDAARYADTNGYNNDEDRIMWPWRDWVIDAFNQNLPYNRFIIEQLAGDLLPSPTLSQQIATAFLRNQGHNTEGGIIPEEYRVEYVADRVHTTSTIFLGLTMQCARCHDHKYDPITQKDFYRFFAFFNNLDEKQASYTDFKAAEPFIRLPTPAQQAQLAALEADRKKLEEQLDPQDPKLKTALTDLSRHKEEVEKAEIPLMVMKDMANPRDTFILKRGQYDQPGEKVTADVPSAVLPMSPDAPRNRLGLAQWLVDPANPLTARVAVNRWWQMYFGAGLVKTSEDFGATGELPSHPDLLDFLATELIASGWDVKAMQKLVVTSATYRQSSRISAELLERDPENRLLARGPRFRLPAETIRDNALAISGLLRERVGGPSVRPYQPDGLWQDVSVDHRAIYVEDQGEGLYRRSLYTFWKRTCPPPAMMTFDAPLREVCLARRARTNTPLQSLVLMNDPEFVEAARKLAERMMTRGGDRPDDCLNAGYRMAIARVPTDDERRILLGLLQDALDKYRNDKQAATKLLSVGRSPGDASHDPAELAAYTIIASTILNLDETISKR